ncbi:Ycf20-like protein [Chlorella vulgaris]
MTPTGALPEVIGGRPGALRGAAIGRPSSRQCLEPLQRAQGVSRRGRRRISIEARDRQRRLLTYVLSMPQRIDRYLESSWFRKWSWAGISFCSGFYAGNIATLSFGALAVNDVLAAVITLLFCEVVTDLYYTAKEPSIFLWYLNAFKIGLIGSLLADAAKLGS